ncbi:MAG: colicin immunity domain-containing protein [Bacteroidota bacterium]
MEKYLKIITAYTIREISIYEFQKNYFLMVKTEEKMFPPQVFKVIGTLFSDLDSYCEDPELWEEGDLNAQEILKNAKTALHKLKRLTEDEQRTKD